MLSNRSEIRTNGEDFVAFDSDNEGLYMAGAVDGESEAEDGDEEDEAEDTEGSEKEGLNMPKPPKTVCGCCRHHINHSDLI